MMKFEMKEKKLQIDNKSNSPLWWMFVLKIVVMMGVVGMLSACGQAEVQPLRFNVAPWLPNEESVYQLTDVDGNYAGTARYDISLIDGDEGELWNLRREINSQGMQEIVVVDMSLEGFRPQQSTLIRMDKSGTEVIATEYSGSDANLELTTKQNIMTVQRISVPSDAREQASLAMLLRALPLAANYATRMNIFLPVVGNLDRITVQTVRQEEVTVPAGTFDTWFVRLETNTNSKIEAWVSTQAPYPVVKFVDSRNGGTFELSEFQPGQ